MEISIPFPIVEVTKNYQDLRAYFRQLEVAVHYALKSIDTAESSGVTITEDSYIKITHPSFDTLVKRIEEDPKGFEANYYDELQNIGIKIVIN